MLPLVWALIIGTAVALYVVLDGFDLGVGILFPFLSEERERDQMMNSVAPYWDGNETWLVLGGAGLWVAFPKAFAIIMPAVYLPLMIMLLALVFRGVAFEFRWVAKPNHARWDVAFSAGSTLAAFAQGLVLGALLQGVTVRDGQFAGGTWDFLSPFSLLCGCALVIGYALLGATWLMMKTEGSVERHARRLGMPLLAALMACVVAVSVWTPLALDRVAERWFLTCRTFRTCCRRLPLVTAKLCGETPVGTARLGSLAGLGGSSHVVDLRLIPGREARSRPRARYHYRN
ncbi:MAG: cytochrome d ubiquinol oxidase subunit II [Gammaproteobacteria bacterium]|nr:cytochrome d ubiquinol oxidase subunit II [Gammaproteobacteria bacterium]